MFQIFSFPWVCRRKTGSTSSWNCWHSSVVFVFLLHVPWRACARAHAWLWVSAHVQLSLCVLLFFFFFAFLLLSVVQSFWVFSPCLSVNKWRKTEGKVISIDIGREAGLQELLRQHSLLLYWPPSVRLCGSSLIWCVDFGNWFVFLRRVSRLVLFCAVDTFDWFLLVKTS